jgi:hypothetical protein
MSQSDRRNSSPGLDWLNPSGEWAQEDYGSRPAAASEPYDWTLKDSEIRTTKVIPIVSPVQPGSSKLGRLKRKDSASESSSSISVKKKTTGKLFGGRITGLMQPVTKRLIESLSAAPVIDGEKTEEIVRIEIDKTAPRPESPKSPGWALPLLLLAVIALFVFAYIAQK